MIILNLLNISINPNQSLEKLGKLVSLQKGASIHMIMYTCINDSGVMVERKFATLSAIGKGLDQQKF